MQIAKKIKPLHDRIIVEQDKKESKTESGIIIPESVGEAPLRGTIIACGDGVDGKELEVKVGDRILFGHHGWQEVEYEGESFLMMRERDVICVIEQ